MGYQKLVTVLRSSDYSLMSVAKSILDEAEIYAYLKGERFNQLFGNNNPIACMELQVKEDDFKIAKELLAKLQ